MAGFWDKGVGYLKDKTDGISVGSTDQNSLLKTFSFTGASGGVGTSTLITYIAQYLANVDGKQVVILDLNFLQPDILYRLDVDVTSDNSIINYLKGTKKLEECFIPVESMKKLHLITASPKDSVELIMNMAAGKDIVGHLIDQLSVFDYVLINLPYLQPFITFIEPIQKIDKGYIILDERLENLKRTQGILDFIHIYQNRAPVFSNLILNKLTEYDYPEDVLTDLHCNVVSRIPLDNALIQYTNSQKSLLEKNISLEMQLELANIIENMKR